MPDFYIDCAQDFDPDIGIERRNAATGQYEPYAGLADVTLVLAATRGSATPIDATLEKPAAERANAPGTIHPATAFDVQDLQDHLLPTYKDTIIFLNLFKSGEIQGQPLTCLVRADRLGP